MIMLSPDLVQVFWNLCFYLLGLQFIHSYDWELNRKRGRVVSLDQIKFKQKKKKDKKLRYLFKRPTIPPESLFLKKVMFVREGANQKKKKNRERVFLTAINLEQALNVQFQGSSPLKTTQAQSLMERS